ncbi:MAG: glycosyl hydrolase family 59 [Oscillospiraceae bacterium]|nr:glycosyl hydrolase family 59 [Oscillospiraceae bacterium]
MVSGNNSSRLLLDYKADHPDRYYEILDCIFGADGVGVNHLKLEMGSDINSTSGTEPCVMRYEDEIPDVTRGAGFQLAADVKKRYPDVTLDMLYWSEPAWVTKSADVYASRYKWYKETLVAAYNTYGLKFDYVSLSRNERDIEPEWIKYAAKRLKTETDCPYDFSAIKIVAADEDNAWWIAQIMADDEDVRNAVDVVGSHYTSHATDNAKLMSDRYGKEIWFSEGSPPMNYPKGTARFNGSGLSGINGTLDIANRIIAMYPCGRMTLYEYQPVVSAYYDGVTFCHKALINAAEPWSGYYTLESGYYMSLHFSRFFPKGWSMIDSACYNDSKKGGDGHALVDTVYSFMTACNPETGDYSTVIVNSTDKDITYEFEADSAKTVNIWETRGSGNGAYDENYFRKTASIIPQKSAEEFTYSVTVKPFSLVTVSTLDTAEEKRSEYKSEVMALPYIDNFSYDEAFASSRGGAPKYTTDQGGAFEVADGRLVQKITPETKAMEWGGTPAPTTCLGDDRWYNYSVSADVQLAKSDNPEKNFVGAGLRYSLACMGASGYSLIVFENRTWQLRRNTETVLTGKADFNPYETNTITVSADEEKISACINGKTIAEYSDKIILSAGRAALYSSYNKNSFSCIRIVPLENKPYCIERVDDTDFCFEYKHGWEHSLMCGFANYKRTLSTGSAGAEAIFRFRGTGFALFGNNDEAEIEVSVDGTTEKRKINSVGNREIFYSRSKLADGEHTVIIRVLSGTLNIDSGQIMRK